MRKTVRGIPAELCCRSGREAAQFVELDRTRQPKLGAELHGSQAESRKRLIRDRQRDLAHDTVTSSIGRTSNPRESERIGMEEYPRDSLTSLSPRSHSILHLTADRISLR